MSVRKWYIIWKMPPVMIILMFTIIINNDLNKFWEVAMTQEIYIFIGRGLRLRLLLCRNEYFIFND